MTNPENFTAHRKALMRLSELCGSLTSAFLITKDTAYSNAAKKHLNAWFVNDQTKRPYCFSLFNLDGIVIGAQIMSDEDHDLWSFTTADGKSVAKALEYMAPYVADKSKWFLKSDVMNWEAFPGARPTYILGAFRLNRTDYYNLWKQRKHFLEVEAIRRNVPLKFPLLWLADNK